MFKSPWLFISHTPHPSALYSCWSYIEFCFNPRISVSCVSISLRVRICLCLSQQVSLCLSLSLSLSLHSKQPLSHQVWWEPLSSQHLESWDRLLQAWAWPTQWIPGQSELHKDTLSQKDKNKLRRQQFSCLDDRVSFKVVFQGSQAPQTPLPSVFCQCLQQRSG